MGTVATQPRQNFTTVSFELRRDLADRFKKLFPKYGQVSKTLRSLVQQVVEGRIKIK
jgi:hypothetical protein